jgi:hypothetical protein
MEDIVGGMFIALIIAVILFGAFTIGYRVSYSNIKYDFRLCIERQIDINKCAQWADLMEEPK